MTSLVDRHPRASGEPNYWPKFSGPSETGMAYHITHHMLDSDDITSTWGIHGPLRHAKTFPKSPGVLAHWRRASSCLGNEKSRLPFVKQYLYGHFTFR